MRLGCQWLQALEIAFRQLVIDQVFIFALFFVDAMPISTIGRRPRGHDHSAGEAYGAVFCSLILKGYGLFWRKSAVRACSRCKSPSTPLL